ncbi:MAG: efflux RND transporter periplasmic adaptor subunit [Candidatus Binatia bacterium]
MVFKFSRTIGLLLWLVAVLSSTRVLAQRGPIPVEVVPVVSRTLQEEVSFIATLEADISTTVGAVVSGLVVESDVREGDPVVSKKTVLVQLDRTSREIALREARASIDRAQEEWKKLKRGYRSEEVAQRRAEVEEQKALLARAEQDFRRAERLFRDELISLAELQRVESEYLAAREKQGRVLAAFQLAQAGPRQEDIARAEAEFREAKARRDLIAYELSRTTLFASITGFLVRKYVEVGTWVNPGDPVADLVSLDPVYAAGPVGERKIGLLRKGLRATVVLDAFPGQSFEGSVAYIVPRADPQSHTFPVKVRVSNRDGRLKSGMLARVTVKVGDGHPGFLVPKDAIVYQGADEVIFIVENGLAKQYKVKTGRAVKGLKEVYHRALKPGQEVVVLGNESLSDGAKVRKVNHRNRTGVPRSR